MAVNTPEAVKQRFENLKQSILGNPVKLAEDLDYASGLEPGLRHPFTEGMVLLRDDGAAEISSGPAAHFIVDGPAGQATTVAPQIALIAGQNLHLHAPGGGLWFGFQRLNPWWQSSIDAGGFDVSASWYWEKAPLHQKYPESLKYHQFVAGVPKEGQYNVSLDEIIGAKPLFGPNELYYITAKKMAEILKWYKW